MHVDVRQLRWFQQVADGITVTEVSELDRATQSGVSRALTRLEDELGVALFRRAGRTLRMTRAGATFKRYVDKALHDLDDGLAALSEQASPDSGTVSLAFQPSLGTWLVPDLVRSFRLDNPGVRFELHQVRDNQTGRLLATGEADLEITTLAPRTNAVRWQPLVAERLHVAVPSRHPLAARSSIGMVALKDEPFVMLRGSFELRRSCDAIARAAGFTPVVAFEGDDVPTLVGFVAAGLGVAVVPHPESSSGSQAVSYLRLEDETAVRQIGLSQSVDRPLLAAAARFHEHAVEQIPRALR